MGLFGFFGKQQPTTPPAAGAVPLEPSCYDMAYFILPQYVFGELSKMIDRCHKRERLRIRKSEGGIRNDGGRAVRLNWAGIQARSASK